MQPEEGCRAGAVPADAPGPRRPPAARLPLIACLLLAAAAPPDPQALFNEAVATDLTTDTPRAFALYRSAAQDGMPEAQLNVAVMYDSGRGTARDAVQAATWYAAAATGGQARAAFDLAQLYVSGDGVPRNLALANVWFRQAAAEGLQAAANRPQPGAPDSGQPFSAPAVAYPASGASLHSLRGGLALVWTATPVSAPAAFFVEVMQLGSPTPTLAFSTTVTASATRMPTPTPGRYAWRVYTLCPSLGRYAPSAWTPFSVG